MKQVINILITTLLVCLFTTLIQGQQRHLPFFNVQSFGAQGNGKNMDTKALQKAIDTCYENGGGTVFFPAGVYLSGSLHLKSNVALYLDNGAVLLASPDDNDFDPKEELDFENDADEETSCFHFSLLWGEDLVNVAIVGQGIIDSNRQDRSGPKTIGLKRSKHVTIRDITIQNAGNYAISMLGTDFVVIDGVTILKSYCDGIDPDCCRNVWISNCYIESWDDAICPKASFALGVRRSTEYLTVTNCIIATSSNCFKFGTESGGDFKHVVISNCVMTYYKSKVNYRKPTKPISGITLISADGSHIENVSISNIVMEDVRYPIFLRIRNRRRDMETPVPGSMRHVSLSNISARNALIGCIIAGYPEQPIEDIHLNNINITCQGSGTLEQASLEVSEMAGKYPSAYRFRNAPAYALYSRHVAGLKLEDINLDTALPDLRHAVICEDIRDLEIESMKIPFSNGGASALLFKQVNSATVHGCRAPLGAEIFLKITGSGSRGIMLFNNVFDKIKHVYLLTDGAKDDVVKSEFNVY